jgi:hypothetical protein
MKKPFYFWLGCLGLGIILTPFQGNPLVATLRDLAYVVWLILGITLLILAIINRIKKGMRKNVAGIKDKK